MTQAERLDAIKTFLADRVEDRKLEVHGDDTDTLFDMIEALEAELSSQA